MTHHPAIVRSIIGAYQMGDLWLHGLPSLSDAAAESLSKCKFRLMLRLTSLSDAAAESLSQHKKVVVENADVDKKIKKFRRKKSSPTVLCRQLLDENPAVVQHIKGGKLQAVGRLIGEAKKRNPKINPRTFQELCLKMIEKM